MTEPQETPAEVHTYLGGLPERITLPTSGATVVFRDPEDLRGRDHRAVVDGIRSTAKELAAGMDAVVGTACMLIDSWTLPVPIPRQDPTQLDELKLRDYNAIIKAVAGVTALLFGDDTDTPETAGRPGSPTRPASG